MNANWLPMSRTKTPWPRPGTCTSTSKKNKRYTIAQGNQSREFSSVPNSYESRLNFIKHHSLMDNNIPSYFDSQFPFYVKTSLSERLSTIEVDPNIVLQDSRNRKMKHSSYDLIFVGTTTGRVLKFFNNFSSTSNHDDKNNPGGSSRPMLIESIQIFDYNVPVRKILVHRKTSKLIIQSDDEVSSWSNVVYKFYLPCGSNKEYHTHSIFLIDCCD